MPKSTVLDAISAIEKVFSDTSVSQNTTIERLNELKDDIEIKIACIESDIRGGYHA